MDMLNMTVKKRENYDVKEGVNEVGEQDEVDHCG
jgi:hypothetical protein